MVRQDIIFPTFVSGLIVTVIGAIVISGWFTNNASLIQIMPNFAPMQFNTALCFLICGVGTALASLHKRNIAVIFGALTLTISGLTLLQYFLHMNFGLDQLFTDHTVMTKASQPGRLSPITALCFMLCGTALLFIKFQPIYIRSLAVTALFLCSAALIAYVLQFQGAVEFENIYGWGQLQRMALHTAIGFVLLSTGLIALSMAKKKKGHFDVWSMLPFSLASIIIAITILAWYSVKEYNSQIEKTYFENLVYDTQDAITDRYTLYLETLLGGKGLYHASKSVERDEWQRFVEAHDVDKNLPGINGVGYIDYVEEEDLEEYLEATRADNAPDFVNHPDTDFSNKFIIKYVEPVEPNKAAIGLDIGFEANRREAAERARDTGNPALTKRILLVQDNKQRAGFLLLIPIYKTKSLPSSINDRKEQIQGWIYAPFIGDHFLDDINSINKNQLSFSVYDGNQANDSMLIHKDIKDRNLQSDLYLTTQITLGGNVWTIEWYPSTQFQTREQDISTAILILGLLLSGIFYLMLNRLLHSKQAVTRQVRERTRELRQALAFQDLIAENIPDAVFVKNEDYEIVQGNSAFLNLYPEDERDQVIGTTTVEQYNKEEAEEFLKHDREAFEEGYSHTIESLHFPNGDLKTFSTKKVRFEDAENRPFILAIARDITDKSRKIKKF